MTPSSTQSSRRTRMTYSTCAPLPHRQAVHLPARHPPTHIHDPFPTLLLQEFRCLQAAVPAAANQQDVSFDRYFAKTLPKLAQGNVSRAPSVTLLELPRFTHVDDHRRRFGC